MSDCKKFEVSEFPKVLALSPFLGGLVRKPSCMNLIIKVKFAFLGSTRRERCHQCSKPRAGDFKEKQKHSKNCQDLFQISVHKANLLKNVNHIKLKKGNKLNKIYEKQNVKSQKQCQVEYWEGSSQD